MQIKKGADIKGISRVMRPALAGAAQVWAAAGKELVVTSGLDGVHGAGSRHYIGEALDFRINYWNGNWELAKAFGKVVAPKLEKELGIAFRVILEKTHIHVQWNW